MLLSIHVRSAPAPALLFWQVLWSSTNTPNRIYSWVAIPGKGTRRESRTQERGFWIDRGQPETTSRGPNHWPSVFLKLFCSMPQGESPISFDDFPHTPRDPGLGRLHLSLCLSTWTVTLQNPIPPPPRGPGFCVGVFCILSGTRLQG